MTQREPNFAKVLKELMEQQGVNQLQLADMLGVRQSQVSNWLNGKSMPGYHSMRMLSIKMKISADELLEVNLG